MAKAITNTSPLQYLYRAGILDWLPQLFEEVWTTTAVQQELYEGEQRGYEVPKLDEYEWLELHDPRHLPSQWLVTQLGAGELSVMALALEEPEVVVILDDALARRTAQAAGLHVWGTLRVLLEGKTVGLCSHVGPVLNQLQTSGMWLSEAMTVPSQSLSLPSPQTSSWGKIWPSQIVHLPCLQVCFPSWQAPLPLLSGGPP
jgi:predicted nucleic acid-binding protein